MAEIKVGIVRRTNFKGGKKLYALGLHYTNISEAELMHYMQQNSQLGKGLAVAAVEAFKAAFTTFLMNGHSMQVPYLGTFSLTCNSDTKKVTLTPSDGNTEQDKENNRKFKRQVRDAIENIRVRFTPIAKIRTSAKSVQFKPTIVDPDA